MTQHITMTNLAALFLVSRPVMAKWLRELGLHTAACSPTEIARKDGWCKILGSSLVLWHRQKTVSGLRAAGHLLAKEQHGSRPADKMETNRGIRGNRNRPSGNGTNDDWATPDWLFTLLNEEFHFTLDAAASPHNTKVARFFAREHDALKQSWAGECVWLNPPFSKSVTGLWVRKAHEESQKNATVVMLLPAWTHSDWYHQFCLAHAELRFVQGWVPFKGKRRSNTQVCIVAIFRPDGKGCVGPSIKCPGSEIKHRGATKQKPERGTLR
jgi:site-specific DNA-methyltransferase (adenine-specific)